MEIHLGRKFKLWLLRSSSVGVGDISLVSIFLDHILGALFQNKFHSFFKVGNVSHFEFGAIPQKGHHISVSKQTLGGANFDNIGVDNFGHFLSANARVDANATVGNLVSDPRLAGPGGGRGDDSDDRQNGNGGGNGFRNGRGSFVIDFFGCQSGFGRRSGRRGCFAAFSSTAFGL